MTGDRGTTPGSGGRAACLLSLVALLALLLAGLSAAAQTGDAAPASTVPASEAASASPAQAGDAPAVTTVPAAGTAELDSIVEAARASGATVVVIGPQQAAAAAAASGTMSPRAAIDTAATVRNAIHRMVRELPRLPRDVETALRLVTPADTLDWLWGALLVSAAAIVAGLAVRWLFVHWGRSYFRDIYNPTPRDRAEKIGFLLLRTVLMWCGVLIFLAGGVALVVILAPQHGPDRVTGLTAISAAALFLAVRALFWNVFVPDAPQYRLVPFDDDLARRLYRQLMVIFVASTFAFGICIWMAWFALPAETHDFLLVLSSIFTSVLMIGYVLIHRRAIAAAIAGTAPDPPRWRRVLAAIWHALAIVYLVVATAINVVAIIQREGLTVGPVLGPILAFVAGFGVHGILVLLIDRRFRRQEAALHRHAAAAAAAAESARETVAASAAVPADADIGATLAEGTAQLAAPDTAPAAAPVNPITLWRLRWKALAEHIAALASFVVAAATLFWVWGWLEPGANASRLLGIGIVLFLALVAYQAVKTWIDGKLAEEEPLLGAGEAEEGMGPGASRLATLLPLFRNVLLVAIFAIAGMVLLAGLGVDIAPLFAGAGVIGLAIGFGAQTLIRDIFSGAFFLLDDAFRKGEYIDVGSVMGSVEKISVRSFQLRHHNGPLHTVPFGEIKQLTNYSRDWVIMKLPLRLTYGTDVEKVRKLVKKLGEAMQTDPEIGHLFVQPLKSQGVVQMEDSAMILRVKFMTRPGDQFVARRHVYTRVHELFEKEGIHFAHREVTVRIADDEAPFLDEDERARRRRAALGAVQPVIEAAAAAEAGKAAASGPGGM